MGLKAPAVAAARERRATIALFVATVSYFTVGGISFPVLPLLVEERLDGQESEVGLAFGAFAVGMLALRPIVGYVADRFGRRNNVLVGSLMVGLTQLLVVPAADAGLWPLLVVRFLAGAAASFVFVSLATIASELPSEERRAGVYGVFAAMTFVGFGIGPVIGEFVNNQFGFAAAFAVAAGFGVFAAACSLLIGETKPPEVEPRLEGLADLVHPVGARLGLANFVAMIAFMSFQGFIALWTDELGVGSAGLLLFVFSFTAMALRIGTSGLNVAHRRLGAGSMAYVAIAVGMLIAAVANGLAPLVVAAIVLGAGMSLITPMLFLGGAESAPEADRARVLSTITFCNDLGVSAGVPILGYVAELAGFRWMYLTAMGFALFGLAVFRSPVVAGLPGFPRAAR